MPSLNCSLRHTNPKRLPHQNKHLNHCDQGKGSTGYSSLTTEKTGTNSKVFWVSGEFYVPISHANPSNIVLAKSCCLHFCLGLWWALHFSLIRLTCCWDVQSVCRSSNSQPISLVLWVSSFNPGLCILTVPAAVS